jgi:endo-1,4-beta-D-glucanase Y
MNQRSSVANFRAVLLCSTFVAAFGCDPATTSSSGTGGHGGGLAGTTTATTGTETSTTGTTSPTTSGGGGAPPADVQASLGHCTAPSGAAWSDARAAYQKWKTDLLVSDGARGFLRVRRPNSVGAIDTSNSEGISYGMTLAVAMDEQEVFDKLWQYEQLFLDINGLMNWEIEPDGSGPTANGRGAATDGDEDMAFALRADKRWGGQGSLATSYRDLALKQIDLIWKYEVDHTRNETLMPGDGFSGGAAVTNISYFAPAYYRLFGEVTGKQADWNKVVESSYAILAATLNAANKNETNGLVPAWSTPEGVPQAPPNTSHPIHHQLDSCRTPFRLGQDYCWYGETRAKDYLAKINAFYQNIGAANIANGYDLDGTPHPTNPTVNQSAAFVGTAGVGAMSDIAFAALRDGAYAGVATLKQLDGSTYYTESWTGLTLVMMNGGYWNPAP